MNTVNATGWLQKDAWTATTPAPHRRLVIFDAMLENARGQPAPWRCEIEDEALGMRVEAKLVAGAGLMLRGELCAVPFIKHGVHSGFTRLIVVDKVEFSRVVAAAASPDPAATAAT